MIRNVSYSTGAFLHPTVMIERAENALGDLDFDTMIGTGLSGSLVVPLLARGMGKRWAIIRKPTENSHADDVFEGEIGDRWLFVDDFISSGATLNRVVDAVENIARRYKQRTDLVGSYEYQRLGDASTYGLFRTFDDLYRRGLV